MLRADNTSAIVICIAPLRERGRWDGDEELVLNLAEGPSYSSPDASGLTPSRCCTPPLKVRALCGSFLPSPSSLGQSEYCQRLSNTFRNS